ncbi:MAG TPA: hypothetical protein VIS77_05150 [Burkholderiales bacterium]
MLASAAHETEVLTQILALSDDPVGFVHYAYPWGRPGTPFEKFNGPRRWQLEEFEAIGEHVARSKFAIDNGLPAPIYKGAWASGRGPGKSAFFGMLAHWQASTRIGSTTIVAANTESQLRTRTFPEFGVWFGSAINSHWFSLETMRIVPAPWLLELVRKIPEEGGLGIDPKYWYVQGQTWSEDNPNAFAGVHNPYGLMLAFDEAAGIATPVWEVAEGFFTEENPYRFWLAASQMRNRQGRFYDLFNDPRIGAGWRTRTISTRGLPGVDQAIVEDQIRRYGEDSDFVRVEIMGLPPRTSEDQFIPWDAVRAAQQNTLVPDYGEPLVLGVDPAPRGKTAWRFRQGRNARDCCGSATMGSWLSKDNVQIAEEILKLDQKYKPDAICIDFGMGTGVIDVLKRKRTYGRVHEVKFGDAPHGGRDTEWGSHAIELWGRVRDWLPGGMLEKDSGEKGTLSQQLTDRGWKWSGREEGKKILEPKEDMHKRGVASPDDADALACTFEVNPPRNDSRRGGRQTVAEGVGGSAFFD